MTPEQAARWLADVQRWTFDYDAVMPDPEGYYISQSDALAAIARHIAPGDDLVERLLGEPSWAGLVETAREATDRLSALTAQVAEVTRERDDAVIKRAAWELSARQMEGEREELRAEQETLIDAKDTAEAEAATLRARLARMEGAAAKLAVILDRNESKGPLSDIELMFCWLAAQDVRAALRGYMVEKPE